MEHAAPGKSRDQLGIRLRNGELLSNQQMRWGITCSPFPFFSFDSFTTGLGNKFNLTVGPCPDASNCSSKQIREIIQ